MIRANRRARGVNLVEMLTVMAILTILVALLMPTHNHVREAANQAICASNLHQIGVAVAHQRTESKFRIYSGTWIGLLTPSLQGELRSFICPSDKDPDRQGPPMAAINVYGYHGELLQTMMFQEGPMVKRVQVSEDVYRLEFEDIPGGGDRDFDDFFVEVTELENNRHHIRAWKGSAGYSFDVADQDGNIIAKNVQHGGVEFELSGSVTSYGMNKALDGTPNEAYASQTAFILDYQKVSAVVNEESFFRDDWADWLDERGVPEFARHQDRCNILQLNGGVTQLHVNQLDPEVEENLRYWLPDYEDRF